MFATRYQSNAETDVEIDMVPIMNMFLVLIPFLLISSSFLHLKAINTSVPVQSASLVEVVDDKKSDIKLTLLVTLDQKKINVAVSADELNDKDKQSLSFEISESGSNLDYSAFTQKITSIKAAYPLSDTILLTPADDVTYESIIKVMDAGRGSSTQTLFPHVVLSGLL